MEDQLSPELVGLYEDQLLPEVEDTKWQHTGVQYSGQYSREFSAINPTATERLSLNHQYSEAVPEFQVNGERTDPYDVAYINHMVSFSANISGVTRSPHH